MLRKIAFSLLLIPSLFSTNALAMNHSVVPGISVEFTLPPNDPQEFTNAWFWTITATCTIISNETSNDIFAEMLFRKGKINGRVMNKGDQLTMTVRSGDKLIIVSDSGSKVRLTNLGKNPVIASCSA